jgi:DNA-binding transcriptional regulator of glucitol operon
MKRALLTLALIVALPQFALAFSWDSKYDSAFRDKITENWNSPAGTGNVTAAFSVSADGAVTNLHVRDESGQAPPAEFIKKLILSKQPFAPPPKLYDGKHEVWMNFKWAPNIHSASGPYFDSSVPDAVKVRLGLQSVPFINLIGQKLSGSAQKATVPGKATVYLKLKKDNGAIEKIFIVTEPKNPAAEKEAYAIAQRAHPFGPVDAAYAAAPYFKVNMDWGANYQSSSAFDIKKPPAWLK